MKDNINLKWLNSTTLNLSNLTGLKQLESKS